LNEINRNNLGDCFIIDFEAVQRIAAKLFPFIDDLYDFSIKEISKVPEDMKKTIIEMHWARKRLDWKKFTLPLLEVDWSTSIQSINKRFQKKVINMLLMQQYPPLDHFATSFGPQ
jgi:hypothetical protein